MARRTRHFNFTLRLIPNPLDLSPYEFQSRQSPQPHLFWLRAYHVIYSPSLAPRVLAHLRSDFPNAHLTIIVPHKGDGSLQANKIVSGDLGVSDQIDFPGGVPKTDVPALLNKGDMFINTTNIDNTPVSVIEAMACVLPVVSTNVRGLPY